MPFNVSEFRSSLPYDGARPNLFECIVNFPPGVPNSPGPAAFTFKCRAASLPGSTIGTVIAPYFGREIKLAGNRTFEDWTVTLINDESMATRHALEQWMAGINSHVTNVRQAALLNPATEYQADMLVRQYGKVGETALIAQYNIIGAFPIMVEPIQLDWGANDQLEEFSVTFAYQWWETYGVPNSFDGSTQGLPRPANGVGE